MHTLHVDSKGVITDICGDPPTDAREGEEGASTWKHIYGLEGFSAFQWAVRHMDANPLQTSVVFKMQVPCTHGMLMVMNCLLERQKKMTLRPTQFCVYVCESVRFKEMREC